MGQFFVNENTEKRLFSVKIPQKIYFQNIGGILKLLSNLFPNLIYSSLRFLENMACVFPATILSKELF
jgi:hypothetical protein